MLPPASASNNHSPLDFEKLKGDTDNIAKHLMDFIGGCSGNVRRIFDYFEFTAGSSVHPAC